MKFVLEMELGEDAGKEVARALRYWAGAVGKMELKPGDGMAIYDSGYREVGKWAVTEPAPEDEVPDR